MGGYLKMNGGANWQMIADFNIFINWILGKKSQQFRKAPWSLCIRQKKNLKVKIKRTS